LTTLGFRSKMTRQAQHATDKPPVKLPPGPEDRSWAGFYRDYTRDPLVYLSKLQKDYGDVVTLRAYNYRVFFLSHPEHIEEVLVTQARKFVKGRVLKANKRLFGDGLLTSEGDLWLRQRRMAQPAFHRARVTSYGETMVRFAERLIAEWRHGETRDIHAEMMRLALQIVAKTLFDAEVDGDALEVGKALEAITELNSDFRRLVLTPPWLPTRQNIRAALATRRLNKIIYRIIAERRAAARDTGDFLSMLLAAQDEDGSRMNDQQLRDEAITIFLAGHETTAIALSWTWWLLAQNPEVEAKLHAELDTVLAGRSPRMEDLPRLAYTEKVIAESLRLYPPAWGMPRLAIEDAEIGGYRIPKGCGVSVSQWVVHRDPRWFEEPLAFRPERWDGELQKRLPRFAYFPFGGGPRQCIGNSFALMEATLVLATITQKFRFRLAPDHVVTPLASITLRPRHGIRATLESRGASQPLQNGKHSVEAAMAD
jgi:cytochrome P450